MKNKATGPGTPYPARVVAGRPTKFAQVRRTRTCYHIHRQRSG